MSENQRVAVLIPCHNEETAIGTVIDDFRAELPEAAIYVFDNCCTDKTAEIARDHGAIVVKEPRKGKGNVVERMLEEIAADCYVMVDGDDTYPASSVRQLMAPVLKGDADMVVGARLENSTEGSFRLGHVAGNTLVRWTINHIFSANLTDILSGYRVFNRRVRNHIPIVSSGFEVETELTIQLLYYNLKLIELPINYKARPTGSVSKLRTIPDGIRVLWMIFSMFRSCKPLTCFGAMGLLLFVMGAIVGSAPIQDYINYRYVYHVPRAILATGLILLSGGTTFMGLVLHALNWRFLELHNIISREERQYP